jgi:hypothetical protein
MKYFFVLIITILMILKINADELKVELKALDENNINISVNNISNKNITAYSYVKTYENQYDYFVIEALIPGHDKIVLYFIDDRDQSGPVIVKLLPGESISHDIDLVKWSTRRINKDALKKSGFEHLPHGIKIRAKYTNAPCKDCNDYYKSIWTGSVYSGWVDF